MVYAWGVTASDSHQIRWNDWNHQSECSFCTFLERFSHVCSILNGLSGALQLAIPTFSARWFPSHERTTATSVVCSMNNLGSAFSFLLPNLFVPDEGEPRLQRWYIQRFMLIGDLLICSLSILFEHLVWNTIWLKRCNNDFRTICASGIRTISQSSWDAPWISVDYG